MSKENEFDNISDLVNKDVETHEKENNTDELSKMNTKKFPIKKLPLFFKKKYTDKKLNEKLYSKLYVPEDKKYIQSLFVECGTKGKKNIPLFAIPKDLTFTKKEIKRLKKLKKELKKQKGRIKLLPLIATLSFICAVFIVFTLTKNFIIKKAITTTCESVFEAKCDIALVDFNFFDSSFKMKQFEIANKNEPMKNLVFVDSVVFDFDLNQLLKARFVADELSITGVATNTDRTYSGDLTEKKLKKIQKKKEKEAKKATKSVNDSPFMQELQAKTKSSASIVENSFINLFDEYNPENILKNCYAQLQSPALSEEVKTKTIEIIKKWESTPKDFEQKITELEKTTNKLLNFDYNSIQSNPTKIKEVIEDFNEVINSTNELKNQTEKTLQNIQSDFNTVQNFSKKIQSSIQNDMNVVNKEISKFTSLNLDSGTKFFTDLFEKVLYDFLGKNYHYVKKATDLLSKVRFTTDNSKKEASKDKKTTEEKNRERLPGRNVVYRKDSTPKFWIKKAAGFGPNFDFEGNHLSSNMDGIGKPANVNVNLDLLGIQHNANVIVDLRTNSNDPMVKADYSGDNFAMNLPSSVFGSSPGVPNIASKSKLNIVAKVYENDFFEISGTALLRDMNITAVPFEPKYAFDIYASVLSKIKDVRIEVGTGFDASSGLILKINSDLDKKVFSAFSQELKVQLASITKQAEAELSKKISEMTNGAISQINIFNDIQGKINNSNNTIDAIKKELENKKKQIELYLTEQVNTAIDGAKKEVENRLKDSISNDVKDKFLNLGKGKF